MIKITGVIINTWVFFFVCSHFIDLEQALSVRLFVCLCVYLSRLITVAWTTWSKPKFEMKILSDLDSFDLMTSWRSFCMFCNAALSQSQFLFDFCTEKAQLSLDLCFILKISKIKSVITSLKKADHIFKRSLHNCFQARLKGYRFKPARLGCGKSFSVVLMNVITKRKWINDWKHLNTLVFLFFGFVFFNLFVCFVLHFLIISIWSLNWIALCQSILSMRQ